MTPDYQGRVLAGLLAALIVVAAALVSADGVAALGGDGSAGEFQRLVGGLGLGPTLELSECPCAFDARLGRECARQHGPLPGGGCYCPEHAWINFCRGAHTAAGAVPERGDGRLP